MQAFLIRIFCVSKLSFAKKGVKYYIKLGSSIKFWGVRGSIATPGGTTVRYGGNTACIEVRHAGEIIILDAGTGLRLLGKQLLAEFPTGPLNLTLLLSHTRWDHIQGLPFFAPIYEKRCHLRILGCEGARKSLEEALTGQMETTYFPVPLAKLPSNIEIDEITEFDFTVGAVRVQAQRANHPGFCVGYKLSTPEGQLVFFPDAEPPAGAPLPEMVDFIRGAEVLILDSQYNAVEYEQHQGWGHGCVDQSVALAAAAGVRQLFLFHHDPDHDDQAIDQLVEHGRALAHRLLPGLQVDAAREGTSLVLGGGTPVRPD
jgi:phosphoribosyl 1,2-cyclic phosphodiesterase